MIPAYIHVLVCFGVVRCRSSLPNSFLIISLATGAIVWNMHRAITSLCLDTNEVYPYPLGLLHWQNDNPLLWCHNRHDCVPNHQPHHCLLNCLFGRRSKKTSKLHVTGLCVGNSPGTGEFPAQMASNMGKGFHLMTSSCIQYMHMIGTLSHLDINQMYPYPSGLLPWHWAIIWLPQWAIIWLPQCLGSNHGGYGWINHINPVQLIP